MNKYRFSIVTVCYNAQEYIENTIFSVEKQNFENYEYIFIDGASQDRTLEIIQRHASAKHNWQVYSQKDYGIYDAMNKGIRYTDGDYIYFLNAGDTLYQTDTLKKVDQFISKRDIDIVYGNIIKICLDNSVLLRKFNSFCSKKEYFLLGDCICHQSIFSKRELLLEHEFNIQYSVCADKEWMLYNIKGKKKFIPLGFPVSYVLEDGYSLNNLESFEKETSTCIKKYMPYKYVIYLMISGLKKNRNTRYLLRELGKMFYMEKQ